jgi:hypothetical protein
VHLLRVSCNLPGGLSRQAARFAGGFEFAVALGEDHVGAGVTVGGQSSVVEDGVTVLYSVPDGIRPIRDSRHDAHDST